MKIIKQYKFNNNKKLNRKKLIYHKLRINNIEVNLIILLYQFIYDMNMNYNIKKLNLKKWEMKKWKNSNKN